MSSIAYLKVFFSQLHTQTTEYRVRKHKKNYLYNCKYRWVYAGILNIFVNKLKICLTKLNLRTVFLDILKHIYIYIVEDDAWPR